MKPRLIILSDLWGFEEAEWVNTYHQLLHPHFELEYYDSRKLVDLDLSDNSKSGVHVQFVNGGIERGVFKLGQIEKESIWILGFSVGGTIAWKAALKNLKVEKLYAISSTRLRYEKEKPNCDCNLFFGKDDRYSPSPIWAEDLGVNCQYLPAKGHECYEEDKVAMKICKIIIKELKNISQDPPYVESFQEHLKRITRKTKGSLN